MFCVGGAAACTLSYTNHLYIKRVLYRPDIMEYTAFCGYNGEVCFKNAEKGPRGR
jgi:hypothetical protein